MPDRKAAPFSEFLLSFVATFPFAEDVQRLFRASDARIIWARQVKQHAPARSFELHVRFPRLLEDHFGLTRQFLVYCLATDDIRTRDAMRIQALIRGAESPIEPDFAILISDDPRTKEKLNDWAIERTSGISIVPVHRAELRQMLEGGGAQSALRDLVGQWIAERNLYDQRSPVTGERFFGRGDMLRNLDRRLAQGSGHVGVFGLRRIGKTSLILELKDRLNKRPNVLPLFIDLESTVGSAHAAFRIAELLAEALSDRSSLSLNAARRALKLPDVWHEAPAPHLIAQVADSARALLTDGALRDQHLVLLLDESETLLPSTDAPDKHALQLFRALRGVSQETRQLSLVLAGVNATPTESPFLGAEDNPLFGLLSSEYLGPLEYAECEEMIRRVGRKMQVRWDGPGVASLVRQVGAHPLLARLAASDVATIDPARPLRPTVAQVEEVLEGFHQRNSAIFEQMVQSLQRYYPDELDLLRIIASGDLDFAADLVEQTPALLNHLAGYGVLDPHHLSVAIPVFERWLHLHQA